MAERRFSHRSPGIWNGCVNGFQPCHQLIAMTARSSMRHKLIWCSPPLLDLFCLIVRPTLADAPMLFSRATPKGPNNNPVSIAFSVEWNSGIDDGNLVNHYDEEGVVSAWHWTTFGQYPPPRAHTCLEKHRCWLVRISAQFVKIQHPGGHRVGCCVPGRSDLAAPSPITTRFRSAPVKRRRRAWSYGHAVVCRQTQRDDRWVWCIRNTGLRWFRRRRSGSISTPRSTRPLL